MKPQRPHRNHLPLLGAGPLFVSGTGILTALAVVLRKQPWLAGGRLSGLRLPLTILGLLFIFFGIILWIEAVLVSRIDQNIKDNRLVTSGIYAWVRNPIYSAFWFLFSGILLTLGNAFFLVLPFVFWLYLTLLVKQTEEKWLNDRYGEDYRIYCRRVNRCLPFFPRWR